MVCLRRLQWSRRMHLIWLYKQEVPPELRCLSSVEHPVYRNSSRHNPGSIGASYENQFVIIGLLTMTSRLQEVILCQVTICHPI